MMGKVLDIYGGDDPAKVYGTTFPRKSAGRSNQGFYKFFAFFAFDLFFSPYSTLTVKMLLTVEQIPWYSVFCIF
jgi:hypothetical protein